MASVTTTFISRAQKMMQLYLSKDSYHQLTQQKFEPLLHPSTNPILDLSATPWVWHARQRQIFDRNIWLFIESESQFCLCFFDMQPRELKQLDITLWLRLMSEYKFISSQADQYEAIMPIEFLSVVRSWIAPFSYAQQECELIDERADYIFNAIQKFLHRPLPIPVPTQREMEFSWRINTDLRPEMQNELEPTLANQMQANLEIQKNSYFHGIRDEVETSQPICDKTTKPKLEIVQDLTNIQSQPRDPGQDIEHDQDDANLAVMELIHKQFKTSVLSYVSPVLLFTSRVTHMLSCSDVKYGQVLKFKPKV